MTAAPPSLVGSGLIEFMREVSAETPPGCFVEVGVYKGGTAWHLAEVAREQGREIHLFDTFNGIPCALPEDNHVVGDFADTDVDAVMAAIPDAVFHVGVFPLTMPAVFPDIAFVHVDCDQYETARAVIDLMSPLMVKGGVMHFDDYGCTWGVTKAVDETFGGRVKESVANRGYVVFE